MGRFEDRLATACNQVGDTALELLDWIDDNPGVVATERISVMHELFRSWHDAKRLAAAVAEFPATAFVGPARSGRTSLVSTMIERGNGPLTVRFDGIREQINLARQIIPEGGKWGAAATLRLTARNLPTPQNFPIAVRLLSLPDLIKVLGTAWYSAHGSRGLAAPTVGQTQAARAQAERKLSTAPFPGLSEEDIWDIRIYFASRLGDEPALRALTAAGFWEALAVLAPSIPNDARGRLLSLLWGGSEVFTATFVKLADTLLTLGYGQEAACALDAVLGLDSRTGKLLRRTDSIINAQTLTGLADPDEQTVVVRNQFAQWASLPRTALAALITEVRLPLRGWNSELLERADILEFPAIASADIAPAAAHTGGAGDASGKAVDQALARDPQLLGQIYLAAKSSYLLERAIRAHEITSLVVCMDPTSRKVGELAGLVAAWVEATHGADPVERETEAAGLFVAITKLDKLFAEPGRKGGERGIDWKRRFDAALLDAFGQGWDWPSVWTPTRAFDNVLLVRNPAAKAKHLCEFNAAGRETGYKAGQLERIARARRDFLESPAVRRHVADPATVWREAFELDDGGLEHLAQSLAQVSETRVKHRQLVKGLDALRARLKERVQRYHESQSPILLNERRRAAAMLVVRRLRQCAESDRLGALIRALQLPDQEFADVLLGLEPKSVKTNGANGHAYNGSHAGNGHANGGAGSTGANGARPSAEAARYARATLAHWIGSMRTVADGSDAVRSFRMPRRALAGLVDELIAGAGRTELEKQLTQRIERVMSDDIDSGERISRAAMYAAGTVSDYVMHLGYDDVLANRHPRRKGKSQVPIFPPRAAIDLATLDDGPVGNGTGLDIEFLSDWSQAFATLVDDNATGGRELPLSAEQNKRLTEILKMLDPTI